MKAILAASFLAFAASAISTDGETLYRKGSGLRATVGQIVLTESQAACTNCHRHPLDGGGEGGVPAPPLAWDILAGGKDENARYDLEGFIAAVNTGRSPDGRMLHGLMPRYALDVRQASALVGYLQRSATIVGVTPNFISIATILPPTGPLRAAGEAAAQELKTLVDVANATGTVHGRHFKLHIWDSDGGVVAIEQSFEASPVLLTIGSVGFGRDSPIAKILTDKQVLDYAPMAGLSGLESKERLIPMRPTLGHQIRRLAKAAVEQFGCFSIVVGDDVLSQEAATMADAVQLPSHNCPAFVVVAPAGQLIGLVNAINADANKQAARPTIFLVAEQAGPVLSNMPNNPKILAITSTASLTDSSRANAQKAFSHLQLILSKQGRRYSPPTLALALQTAGYGADISVVPFN